MNVITIELCAEDRARLDRLAEALERKACESCVATAMSLVKNTQAPSAPPEPADPVLEKLADTLAKVEDPAPAPAPAPVDPPPPTISLPEFQKALTLRCAESDATKAKVRALINEYAPAASQVPPEKFGEVLARLANL